MPSCSPNMVIPMAYSATLLLFLFISLAPSISMANITLSSSLTAAADEKSQWPSPSGDFSFGFRQLNNTNLFLLAIWFNKIPDRTIVWQANGDNPVPAGSTVELTDSGLVLRDPQGQTKWDTKPANTTVSSASMLDTGNFVLAGNNNDYVWESFKNLTDTILPTQILDLGNMLFSRLSETNYSRGRFQLRFSNGTLELNPIAWPSESRYDSYYSSETSTDPAQTGYQLIFNKSADIYIVKNNGEISQLPSWSSINLTVDYYHRATLDFDGVFTQYVHPKNSSSTQIWSPLRSLPEDICDAIYSYLGSGACGYNSYCSIQNSKPACHCPPGYNFIDPNNRFSGCKPTFSVGCGEEDGSRDPEELYEMTPVDDVNWPLGDYERLEPYNQTQCETSCLHDCSCAVAIYNGRICWKKRLPLSNGRSPESIFSRVLIKTRKGDTPSGSSDKPGNKKERSFLVKELPLGGSILFNILSVVAIGVIFFKRHEREVVINHVGDSSIVETTLRLFTYKELEEVTNGFTEELGRGTFGIVYKGVLKNGSENLIAVKKLDKLDKERESEFQTEMRAISKTHHKNLVRLLGFCNEGSHRILIYEFMPNGTLANFLFSIPKPDWNARVQIALGIARGLVYLHEECDVPIIHCDIKPQNILLDECFTARISDFGLAKMLLSNQSRTRTLIRGTRGYVAAEWFKNVPITVKVDVYSFGILLLEIICCRRSVVMELEQEEEEKAILADWAYECYVAGKSDVLVDNDEVAMSDVRRVYKWVMIAIWCIQEEPSRRPTMKMVMQMLEDFVEVPNPPCPTQSFESRTF
ncbi:G-type lectin S-receptor-like serine/threonine-protein kinase LECRK3 [Tripterygium wilfordii]|uniref:G-type lectin S-receptor-like serine/threonine-protein kinase LECRK3 n=1 Tax=Tripterygium wilfordii TaxID=458696 RepID=UPI0018F84E60|nr:G-type lectin S-receptor-like serine/threonine-protein kinase LECRK3 [Tripterygium wilfordii]